MARRFTALMLGSLLALTAPAWAQTTPAANDQKKEEKKDGSTKTVKKEDVKTWTETLEGKEWSMRLATPTTDGDTGLFRLSSAYTLPKGKVAFSLYRDNEDRDPKSLDISAHGFTLAVGASDKLEVFTSIGLQERVRSNSPLESGYFNDNPFIISSWQQGFGDIKLGLKYKFVDDYEGGPLGLAVRGMVKFGTADAAKGLGTGTTSFGIDLIASKNLNYNADLHASIGYLFNGDPTAPTDNALGVTGSLNLANAFKWGVGLNLPSCKIFQFQAEVTGLVYSGGLQSQTSPVDLRVGPVIWIKPGIFIKPWWSYALNYGGSDGDFNKKSGKNLSIGFHPGTRCCEVYTPPPPPPPPANRPPTVSLDCARKQLLAGESTPCRATAADPDGDPLTYTWSASAGRLTGSGADSTLDTTGVPCGTTITVTVQVSDGRGGTASASDRVNVICPEKPKPEVVVCISGGFPRNLARLNNVDKACLDDVASRLRQDPRGRLIIIGHADKAERYADVIGRKRGEAVKAYLVKERGIDEARITVRSAGSSKALDTGTSALAHAKNRRVELIFVPEGATAPEDDD
jgi:hypothetical protein